MSILDDLKAAQTHDIICNCDACARAFKLIGEVRGVLRSDSTPTKRSEDADADPYKSQQARGLLEPVGGA